jgi:hypothetical protein
VLVLIARLAVLWASRGGHRGIVVGLLVTLGLIVAALATAVVVAFSWFNVSLGDGVGRTYHLRRFPSWKPSYHVGVGSLRLDLSQLGTVTQRTRA